METEVIWGKNGGEVEGTQKLKWPSSIRQEITNTDEEIRKRKTWVGI